MMRGKYFGMNGMLRLCSILQQGKGLIKVNGQPLSLVQPEILRFKVRFLLPNTQHTSCRDNEWNDLPRDGNFGS
jgi:hypothetical protein